VQPAIELEGIDKTFVAGHPVLRGVDLRVERGEIHALLGENGAGKSTLMNVAMGLVGPDRGRVRVAGHPVDLARYGPAQAVRLGIGMVHQHSTLVASMTVEENLCFGDPRGRLLFDHKSTGDRLRALSERHQLEVTLGTRVEDLSVGQRQRAEILRALDRGAELLILDEPTATLTPAETTALFPALRQLRESGRSVIFISHKLDEVEALADRVTVLRRGEVTGSLSADDLDASGLGRLMLGRDLPALERPPSRAEIGSRPLFALRRVSASGLREGSALRDIDLEVHAGEIVGVAGIDGNGQRELEEVLAGVRRMDSGSLEVDGSPVRPSIQTLRQHGVSQISGDRESAGLISEFTLTENWILKSSDNDPHYFPHGILDARAASRDARDAVARFDIRPGDVAAKVETLSGGNAQKLAVARELASSPRLLVAVNPTRGLDVGSARFVHEQLLALRERGGGVLLISTELDEVLALSDRVVVITRGAVHPAPPAADRAALGAMMLGREGT
jgi:simple sugar transport system ATP-binding protein